MPDHVAMLLFPEDFAAPRPAVQAEPIEVAPSFTETDLIAARAAGHEAGERAGRAAAASEQHAHVAALLQAIAGRLDAAQAAAAQAAESCAQALAHLLLDALGAALPALRAQYGEAELRRMVAALMPTLTRETEVTLHVHPALVDAVADALAALPARAAVPPRIEADAAIAPGDAVIRWGDGRAVRDSAAAWREVLQVLQPLGLLPDATHAGREQDGVTDA